MTTVGSLIKWGIIGIVAILVLAWITKAFFAVLGIVLAVMLILWLVRFAKGKLEGK